MHKPSVVFLDEPTIGLDVIAKQRIRELIGQLNVEEGVTIFLTSHDAGMKNNHKYFSNQRSKRSW
jgi:ABC-2 type transport system ATP-binding protein